MAIKRAARKELRKTKARKAKNLSQSKQVKDLMKKIQKLISEKKVDEAKKLLSQTYQAIDKAAKNGVIAKNAAARRKAVVIKSISRAK